MSSKVLKSAQTSDGRRLRSERSKQKILAACAALVANRQLVPTAQMIADEAGIPIRSFFRHFPDMETLFRAMDESMRPRYQQLFSSDLVEGELAVRLAATVDAYAAAFDSGKGIFDSTKAQIWRYQTLQENYARFNRAVRRDLQKRLPELKRLSKDQRDMVESLLSFEMWSRLRDQQKLSGKRSKRLLMQLLTPILAES